MRARAKNRRERHLARLSRVNGLINLIEDIRNGAYVEDKELITRQLFPKNYLELLLKVYECDEGFQDFFHQGLWYVRRQDPEKSCSYNR